MIEADSRSAPLMLPSLRGASPAAIQETYARWGCCVLRGFFQPEDFDPLRQEIGGLIDLVTGAASDAPQLERLAALPREQVDAVFTASRRLTAVHQLSVHRRLLALSKALMGTDLVMCPPYKPVRMDSSAREHRLLPWHQDYPYAQDSMDGVVYWIPLQDVDERNGCLQVALGSHTLGVAPVRMIEPEPGATHGHRGLEVADPSVVEAFDTPRVPMQVGDVLLLSSLLFHRSQPNHSGQVRLTVQVRHGNFRDAAAVEKGWPRGHYERHWFDESHPESVVPPGG